MPFLSLTVTLLNQVVTEINVFPSRVAEMRKGRRLRVYTLLLAAAIIVPLFHKTYYLRIEYVVKGEGVVGPEVFSRHFLLAPTIEQFQERDYAQIYVNGVPVSFSVRGDSEGNEYADPGSVSFSGAVNITLVQRIKVATSPFRGKWILRGGIAWDEVKGGSRLGGFWKCNSSSRSFEDLATLSNQLRRSSSSVDQFIVNVIRWTLERFTYSEREEGGVMCPARFMERMTGSCGDVHAFIAALLKIQGVDASLIYAYIVFPEATQSITAGTTSFTLEGAYPHIFALVNISGILLPIDLTASTGSSPADKVSRASVNALDNIIILYRVSSSDPNDYLLVYTPSGAQEVRLSIRVLTDSWEEVKHYAVLVAGLALLLLLLREGRATSA